MYQLCRFFSPGGTISKLVSAPAPYLMQAPASRLVLGVAINKGRVRVGCLLGPDTLLTRPAPNLTSVPSQVDLGAASTRTAI